jgi:hypothetical protein
MSMMATSVVQMGRDVTSMAIDMRSMTSPMEIMARSRVEGQAGMSTDFAKVGAGLETMTNAMGGMALDMGALSVNIGSMTGANDTMNQSMMMNQSIGRMDANMAQMASDINKLTRPESIMTPFR